MAYNANPRSSHGRRDGPPLWEEPFAEPYLGRNAVADGSTQHLPAAQTVTASDFPSSLHGAKRGWPLVGDDMFRLSHRERDGVSRLDPHVGGIGLSAALLGELLLAGHLTVRDGLIVVINAAAPPDVLAHTVLDRIASERVRHPVRTWLTYLGPSAYVEVAGRLERTGHVRTATSRRILTRTVRYVPTDMNAAAWPWARLVRAVSRGEQLSAFDTLLGGLAVATDLHRVALIGDATPFAAAMRPVVAEAAAPIRELISHARATAGDAVITKA